MPPWALGTPNQVASSHFLLLPYIEQDNLYKQANGFSWNVRTAAVKTFVCPTDPTQTDGVFTSQAVNYPFNASAPLRISTPQGVPFGAATYALNAQVAGASLVGGHPVRGSTKLTSITDGTSNTVLFAERYAWCAGPEYPSAATPHLASGSVTWSIWSRGGKNTTNSNWSDGAPAAPLPPATNAAGPDGYSWWDNPLFDQPYRALPNTDAGPGPRSLTNFRQNWDGGVVNPGGIQGNPRPNACDYRRLQALHSGTMMAALADGSVRAVNSSISALTWERVCAPSDGAVLGNDW